MNAHDVAERLADGGPVRVSGGQWMVQCPAHDDSTPSLQIGEGSGGVLLKCFAGCTTEAVLAAGSLVWADLFHDPLEPEHEDAVYRYTDEKGMTLFEVVRRPGKQFRQRTPDRTQVDGYRWNLHGTRRVLYHLPEVLDAVATGDEVWITEGEKDADAVRRRGVTATTNPGGAGKWSEDYTGCLHDASVTIWADADEKGRAHARMVRDALIPVAQQVRVVESAHGKDAYAHLSHGLTLDDVLVTHRYEAPETESLFLLADDYIDQPYPRGEWVIRELMREREVLLLTGFEGMGKSSLLKQIAVCAAIGLHPFELRPTGPGARVLYIDCENSRADCIEDFSRLRDAARLNDQWHEPVLYIHDRLQMDLANPASLMWLVERVTAHAPDLLVIGPLYGLIEKDAKDEEAVRAVKRGITAVHQVSGCAVVMEHHSPHAAPGEARKVRPIGSSLLMRWPSYGFGLLPTKAADASAPFEFQPWRGARRRGRSWPEYVKQTGTSASLNGDPGTGWFWEEAEPV